MKRCATSWAGMSVHKRADDRHVVDQLAELREHLADLDARLAHLVELERRRERQAVQTGQRLVLAYFASSGFGSQVSTCDGPPSAKMWMTALALAGKGGSFGASGLASLAAAVSAEACIPMPRIEAKLIAPKPMPVRSRNWRRVKIESSRGEECSREYLEVGAQESAFMEVWNGKRTRNEPPPARKVSRDCGLWVKKASREVGALVPKLHLGTHWLRQLHCRTVVIRQGAELSLGGAAGPARRHPLHVKRSFTPQCVTKCNLVTRGGGA